MRQRCRSLKNSSNWLTSVFVGGASRNDFSKIKIMKLDCQSYQSKKFNLEKILNSDKLLLPVDVVVKNNLSAFL